ncbi:MAG TPA: SGNH/GDSL hydrolase family protein [Terriglobales bacterium]|nr:SGNH/GDSL hydrolase family protein [Terriglobales bacterium]
MRTGHRRCLYRLQIFLPCAAMCACLLFAQLGWAQRSVWVAAWATSPQPSVPDAIKPLLNIHDQTVRERVRVSVGGPQICLRLSNEYGPAPLLIGSLTVAKPREESSVRTGSIKAVTFGGHNSITIPPGAPVISDPIPFPVTSGDEISISIYFPDRLASPTFHGHALQRAVISQPGDFTRVEKIQGDATTKSSVFVSAVLVPAKPRQRLVVAFGDSITDGDGASDADHTWPSDLIHRLAKTPEASNTAVVNEGIIGNRLLSDCFLPKVGCFGVNALARFERDALAIPGVTHIVLLEGINDVGFPGANIDGALLADAADLRSPEDLMQAYRQLIARAHARGIKLIGATITPFEGVDVPGYYSEKKEATRQAVNTWIRTSGAFDGVIDFDAVLRNPAQPRRILPRFASEDHLHPNDAGYQAMADAVDLALFK